MSKRNIEPQEQKTMEVIKQKFYYWRDVLGLSDWDIQFVFNVEPENMIIDGSTGCTSFEESTKTALVQILNPERFINKVGKFDIEKSIVHELLHLKLSLVESETDEFQKRMLHQILDDLAKSFVRARRRPRHTKEQLEGWMKEDEANA